MLQQLTSLGFIHTCDLLGVDYCVHYVLNNELYCTKWNIHTCYLVNFCVDWTVQ